MRIGIDALPYLAALLHGAAFVTYNVLTRNKKSKPNFASWFIWAFLSTINAFTFSAMSSTLSALQFFTGSIGCMTTFLYALVIGRFEKPGDKDLIAFGFGLMAIGAWIVFQSAEYGNLIAAVAFVISFYPTYEWVKGSPHNETPLPWVMWTGGFGLTMIYLCASEQWQWRKFVMPVICFLSHALIAYLCRVSRKLKFSQVAVSA